MKLSKRGAPVIMATFKQPKLHFRVFGFKRELQTWMDKIPSCGRMVCGELGVTRAKGREGFASFLKVFISI